VKGIGWLKRTVQVVARIRRREASHSNVGPHLIRLLFLFVLLGASGSLSASVVPVAEVTDASASQVSVPTFTTAPALHGAVLVTLREATPGATILYTTDGTRPTASSQKFLAPFLVSSKIEVQAIAYLNKASSAVARRSFTSEIASGTLVWSEEFSNSSGSSAQPDPAIWTYDTGHRGWGNHELETYCAWGSSAPPCSAAAPNAFVGIDGYLHILARNPGAEAFTSARLKTQGLFSFQYGRLEFRARLPEAQGLWPAGWLLGNNVETVDWPACGEQDVMERVNAATTPDFNQGSVHGPGFTGTPLGAPYHFPKGENAAGWHTYGMIWKPGSVSYYVDDPARPYVTFDAQSLAGLKDARWPFDSGQANFIILNLAVGGDYPRAPNSSTQFPAEVLVDYIRLYTY